MPPEKEKHMELVLTFEGLRAPQVSDEVIADTILNDPRIDCDNRKPPKKNSFLGTFNHGVRSKLDLNLLFWFDGVDFWMYDWVNHDWEHRPGPAPFFNFQITL